MKKSHQHRQDKPKPLGSHQSSWIWGRHLVLETLSVGTWPILELLVAEDLNARELQFAEELAIRRGVPLSPSSRRQLEARCRGEEHQGYVAKMSEFPYRDLSAFLRDLHQVSDMHNRIAKPDSQRPDGLIPLFVAMDGIQDPFNFGTMLRSAEIFGAQAVLIGKDRQVGVTSQVARSSVGAVNRLVIVRVSNLSETFSEIRRHSISIFGASEKAEQTIDSMDFSRAVMVVIGNESTGLSPAVIRACDQLFRIPQCGKTNSLNAAAAMAITCYEVRRQQSRT